VAKENRSLKKKAPYKGAFFWGALLSAEADIHFVGEGLLLAAGEGNGKDAFKK